MAAQACLIMLMLRSSSAPIFSLPAGHRDRLTGFLTHHDLMDFAEHVLTRARSAGIPATLLLLDVDHFGSFNDRDGRLAGNRLLKAVAEILEQGCRKTDIKARIGPDRFAVLLWGAARPEALQVGHRFHEAMGPLACTVSIGLASHPEDGGDAAALLAAADNAVRRLKLDGGDGVAAAAKQEAAEDLPQDTDATESDPAAG